MQLPHDSVTFVPQTVQGGHVTQHSFVAGALAAWIRTPPSVPVRSMMRSFGLESDGIIRNAANSGNGLDGDRLPTVPSDREFPVGMNVAASPAPRTRSTAADGTVGIASTGTHVKKAHTATNTNSGRVTIIALARFVFIGVNRIDHSSPWRLTSPDVPEIPNA